MSHQAGFEIIQTAKPHAFGYAMVSRQDLGGMDPLIAGVVVGPDRSQAQRFALERGANSLSCFLDGFVERMLSVDFHRVTMP
jgi:hypothetical protein